MAETQATTPRSFLQKPVSAGAVLTGSGILLTLCTVAGFLGGLWWFLDLFSHFRVQLFAACIVLANIALLMRKRTPAALFCVAGIANLWPILPLYISEPAKVSNPSSTYRVLLMNVNTDGGDPSKVSRIIAKFSPDILVLEEVNEKWITELSSVLKPYPFSAVRPRDDNFGIGLYSRFAFQNSKIIDIGDAEVPSVLARIELRERALTVIATHPLPPGGSQYSQWRNDQLEKLADVIRGLDGPVVVVGDLNTSPWSIHFKKLLKNSGLIDSSQGRGITASWPSGIPLLLIPIDHFLHSADVQLSRKESGPGVGSDHYPLLVDFEVDKVK